MKVIAGIYFIILFITPIIPEKLTYKNDIIAIILSILFLFQLKKILFPSQSIDKTFPSVRQILKQKSILVLFLFSIISIFSIYFSANILVSLKNYWLFFIIIPVPIILLIIIKDSIIKEIFIYVILLTSTILSIWGICEYYEIIPYSLSNIYKSRISASFSNPNHFSSYLSSTYLLLVLYFLQIQNTKSKSILMIILCLIYCNILYSETRGVWISLIAGTLFLSYFLIKYSLLIIRKNKYWVISFFISLTLITAIYTFPSPIKNPKSTPVMERLSSSSEIINISSTKDFALKERLFIWEITFKMVKNSPLFGVGLGNFKESFKTIKNLLYSDEEFKKKYPPNTFKNIKEYAHNEFLHICAESGILSLLFFTTFLLFLFLKLKDLKYIRCEFNLIFMLGVIASILTILIHSLVSYPLHILPTALNFWTFISFLLANSNRKIL